MEIRRLIIILLVLLSFSVYSQEDQFFPATIEYSVRDYRVIPRADSFYTVKKQCMVMVSEEYINERMSKLYISIDEDQFIWARVYAMSLKDISIKSSRETGERRYRLYDWNLLEEQTGWIKTVDSKDSFTIEIYDRLGLAMGNLLRYNMKITLVLPEN